MQAYRVPNDPSPHFLSEEEIARGCESMLPVGFVRINEAEASKMLAALNSKLTPEQARFDRDGRLARCDWTQLADAPLTSAQKAAWRDYRQALRDVPKQAGFPTAIEWPVAP